MLTHLRLACGRDGGLGAFIVAGTVLTGLPKEGQAGRFFSVRFIFYIKKYFYGVVDFVSFSVEKDFL